MFLRDKSFLQSTVKLSCIAILIVMGSVFLFSNHGSPTTNKPSAKVTASEKPSDQKPTAKKAASEEQPMIVCDSGTCFIRNPEDKESGANEAPKSPFAEFDPLLVANADNVKSPAVEEAKPKEQNKSISEKDPFGEPQNTAEEKTPVDGKPAVKIIVRPKPKIDFSDFSALEDIPGWNSMNFEQKIERILGTKITSSQYNLSLDELKELLSDTMQLNVRMDSAALQEAQIDANSAVNFESKYPRELSKVLHETLSPLNLSFISKNDAFVITSDSRSKETMTTKVYAVSDLLKVSDESGSDAESKTDFESLINLIETTVQPKSWKDVSGDENGGSIDRHANMLLVVRNTDEVQRELQDLFNSLRAKKSSQKTVASKSPADQSIKTVRKIYTISDVSKSEPKDGTKSGQHTVLTKEQMRERVDLLITIIEQTIHSKEWDLSGVSILNFEGRLIVVHTEEIQAEVNKLLDELDMLQKDK